MKKVFIYTRNMVHHEDSPQVEKKIIASMRRKGYKITPSRRLLVKTIVESHEHLTPAAIFERSRAEDSEVSLVTTYRTLEILQELGFICEVHGGGSCRSYLLRHLAEHHHHLICSGCGKVADFTDCGLAGLETRLAHKTGFKISGHLLEFLGLCISCQEKGTV